MRVAKVSDKIPRKTTVLLELEQKPYIPKLLKNQGDCLPTSLNNHLEYFGVQNSIRLVHLCNFFSRLIAQERKSKAFNGNPYCQYTDDSNRPYHSFVDNESKEDLWKLDVQQFHAQQKQKRSP